MNKSKTKILQTAVFGFLALVMLISFAITAGLSASNKRLQAYTSADGSYPITAENATQTGTLYTYENNTLTWNKSSLQNLIAPLSAATNGFLQTANAEQIRTANNGKSVIVNFGELHWIVTYCSTSMEGDTIVTLWCSGLETVDGRPFYYGSYANNRNNLYPGNMYSASQVRGVLNGTQYVTDNEGSKSTATQNSTLANIQAAIGDYIVEPQYVAWQQYGQKQHEAVENGGLGFSFDSPNDNWGEIGTVGEPLVSGRSVWYDDGEYVFWTDVENNMAYSYNYSTKIFASDDPCRYDAWKTDKFWLPSLVETGYTVYTNDKNGMWGLTESERSSSAFSYWLRSGGQQPSRPYYLGTTGDYTVSDNGTRNRSIRPALHLNLTAATSFYAEVDGIRYSGPADGNDLKVVGFTNDISPNIIIPETVIIDGDDYAITGIAANAFADCTTLETITFRSATPIPVGENAFDGCENLTVIYVPQGKAGAYRNASGWAAYAGLVEELPETGVGLNITILVMTLVLGGALIAVAFRKKQYKS